MSKRGKQAKRLAVSALAASMAFSPCLSWAAPGSWGGGANFALNVLADDQVTDFEAMRSKWKVLLTGGGVLDPGDQLVIDYAKSIDELAGVQWNALIKLGDAQTDERTCLFADLPMVEKNKTGSSQITLTFDRLKAIVLAYETIGSQYYKDPVVKREIIAALDMMIENHYSLYYASGGTGTGLGNGNNSFGNWYDWRIGTPRQLCDLLLMFYDELTPDQLAHYVEPIMANNKQVDTTGANRTWIANIFIQCGILLGDGELVEAGKAGVKDVFKYVDRYDGFHEDGSFIQHNYYAYNGGYGKALLCTLAPMMYVLNGTDYAIQYEDNCEQIFYDMIFEAYEPLIYGGRFMDMAREREISRVANQDSIPGRQAIRSIIMLTDVLPDGQRERALSMVKEWLSDEEVLAQVCVDPIGGYNEYYLPAGVINMATNILGSDVVPRGSLIRHKRYGAMDRVVHLRDNFGYTVSMSSDRIRNTEGTNDEGLRLWNIGDGLTYLYNSDKSYYSDHYWATVDYQRLPGTTVNRVPGRAPKAGYGTHNPYKFAGGTDLGEFGIAGMEMQGVGTTKRDGAHAKKSWFMFDDEVVALGSDIRSTLDNSGVETIVENRKVAMDKSNTLTVNGVVQNFTGGGDPYIERNQSLDVTSVTAASGKDVTATKSLEGLPANGLVTVSCRVKMPAATDYFAIKLYASGTGAAADQKNVVFLTMREGAFVPRVPNSGNKDAYSTDAALSAKEWHDVRVELDMANQTFNYYFDGKHIEKGVATGTSGTIAADLVNAGFYTALDGGANTLTAFEVMAPGSKAGTMLVDDITVKCGDEVQYSENFEDRTNDESVATIEGWNVVIRDTGAGAGATVNLDETTVIPPADDEFNGVHEDTQWIHLAGNTEDSDVGYYFPGKANITGLRETRLGSWDLVNTYEKFRDDAQRINSFVTFWFDHGEKPQNEAYSYVVLPGKSAEETAAYNENPDVEILRQDDKIHAVRENKLGITGINFFEAGKYGAFTVTQGESVMYKENAEEGTMEISFADPTQTARSLSLKAALPIQEVLEADPEIQVTLEDGVTVFTAVTDRHPWGTAGRSFTVKVKLAEHDNLFETVEPGETPAHWTVDGGSAVVTLAENDNHVLEIAGENAAATAGTVLEYPEEGGSMVSFLIRPVEGKGVVRLKSDESTVVEIPYGKTESRAADGESPLTPGEWHVVKIKVDLDKKICRVMIDGKLYGQAYTYEGDTPELFELVAETGATAQVDNLIVYESTNIAPTRPERLTYTSYGDTYVALKWDASVSDNPLSYILTVNGEEVEAEITENTYTVEGLEPEETYTFTVQAMDDDDNYSEVSAELTVTLLERQNDRYVIRFDDYKSGTEAQNGWTYAGEDAKGVVEIKEAPGTKEEDPSLDELLSDVEFKNAQIASPSSAVYEEDDDEDVVTAPVKATASNAVKKASASNAEREDDDYVTVNKASASNAVREEAKADQALYVYSGTKGSDRNAYYTFEEQTTKQTYRLKMYFDESTPYANFALVGSNGKQAVTMMITDGGVVGYRAGDNASTTVKLLDSPVNGEWIDFVVIADPQTQQFSISANGVEVTGLKFRYETADITKLTLNAPSNGTGGFYVDDILIPADNAYQKLTLTEIEDDLSEELDVPYGTDFYDLALPESVQVKAVGANGEEESLEIRVNWNAEDYDGMTSGSYTIHGTLACPANCIDKIGENKLKIKVNVEREIKLYTVSLAQTAGGTISADIEQAEKGTDVTVMAEPDEGYVLAGWIINGKEINASGDSCTFTLKEDTTVSAVFEAKAVEPEVRYYTVQISDNQTGGTVTANTRYAKEGTEIVITVTPEDGYALKSLRVNGKVVEVDEDLTYTFTLERNTRVVAVFSKIDSGNHGNGGGSDSDDDDSYSTGSYKAGSAAPSYAVSGTWSEADGKWSFSATNGERMVSRWACILWNGAYEWFYFDQEGSMVSGWLTLNGQTFYLQAEANGNRGRMLTGWQFIDGKWYYFNTVSDGNKGALVKNAVTPDGFVVDGNGVWVE